MPAMRNALNDLPLSGAVFTQEGQFGEGMLPMMADNGYSVMLLPKNLFKVQHTDMQAEAFFDGGDEGTEQDNVVLTAGTTSHMVLHALQALADAHGQPAALDEAWRELLLGQVSDSTGWNPYRTETEYALSHLGTAAELATAWDGEAYRIVPALTEVVAEVDADDVTVEEFGLPASLGVVGLTPDSWLVLDHQAVHLAARLDRGLGQVRFVDETLRVDQEACWRFHAASTAAEAVAAGQLLNAAGPRVAASAGRRGRGREERPHWRCWRWPPCSGGAPETPGPQSSRIARRISASFIGGYGFWMNPARPLPAKRLVASCSL